MKQDCVWIPKINQLHPADKGKEVYWCKDCKGLRSDDDDRVFQHSGFSESPRRDVGKHLHV